MAASYLIGHWRMSFPLNFKVILLFPSIKKYSFGPINDIYADNTT